MPAIDFKTKTYKKDNNVRKGCNVPYGTFSKYGNIECVYGITNKITNLTYIGYTKNLQKRIMKHFNNLFHKSHCTKRLQKDFNDYGFDSFVINILCDDKSLNLKKEETKLQIKYGINNIYNEKVIGFYVDAEYRKKMANSSKNSHRTQEYRDKMRKLKTNKIAQIHFCGDIIKVWDSAIEICKKLNHTRSVILSCCNGSKPHAYGYYWRYIDDNGNYLNNGYIKARKK